MRNYPFTRAHTDIWFNFLLNESMVLIRTANENVKKRRVMKLRILALLLILIVLFKSIVCGYGCCKSIVFGPLLIS